MASPSFASLVTILTSLLLISFSIPYSTAISSETISIICLPAKDPPFCTKLLESDPRTSSADVPLLSLISIDLAMAEANPIYDNYFQIRSATKDPKLQKECDVCLAVYQQIKDALINCRQYSTAGDYQKVIDAKPKISDVLLCAGVMDPSFVELAENMPNTLDMLTMVAAYVLTHH